MKKTQILTFLFVGCLLLSSCIKLQKNYNDTLVEDDSTLQVSLSGKNLEYRKTFDDIQALDLSHYVNLNYRHSTNSIPNNTLIIEGDSALVSLFEVNYDNAALSIIFPNIFILNSDTLQEDPISATLYCDSIVDINVSGFSDIEYSGVYSQLGNVSFMVSGFCKISGLNLKTTNFSADLSGSSELDENVNIIANEDIDIKLSGESSIFSSFRCKNMKFDLSGCSSIDGSVDVREDISTYTSGSSAVCLQGQTKNLSAKASGTSYLNIKNLNISGSKTIDSSGSSEIDK